MPRGVVDLLASWLGKLNRHKTWFGVWSLIVLSYVKNWFLSWNISCYRPCLTGQMLRVFFTFNSLLDMLAFCTFYVIWFILIYLFFFCLLAHCLCALLFSVFSFSIFQWSLLIIQKKKKSTEKYNNKLLSITPWRRLSQTNLKQNFIVSKNLETYSSSLLLNRKLYIHINREIIPNLNRTPLW